MKRVHLVALTWNVTFTENISQRKSILFNTQNRDYNFKLNVSPFPITYFISNKDNLPISAHFTVFDLHLLNLNKSE